MDVIFTPGAGLDVHKKTVMACRVTPDPTGRRADGIIEVKECGTLTVDLLAWSDWLAQAGMTHVAMESPDEYGKPVYNLLEGEYTLFLVNAAHVKQVPGRQTDKADARWLATRMRHGLRQASFIPPVEPRELRDLTCYRTKVVQERGRAVNRVQGVLERATIKLASVATDVMGVSGRAILAALVEGRADPAMIAELATGRMRSKIPLLEQALTGLVRNHHRQLLALQLAHIDVLDDQIDILSVEITHCVTELSADDPPAPLADTAGATGSTEDASAPAAPLTFTRAITVLDTIPGVDQRGAERSGWWRSGGSTGRALAPPPAWRPGGGAPQATTKARASSAPARESGPAHRLDATGPRSGPHQGYLCVGLVSAPGRPPGEDTRHHGGGPCDRGQCLP